MYISVKNALLNSIWQQAMWHLLEVCCVNHILSFIQLRTLENEDYLNGKKYCFLWCLLTLLTCRVVKAVFQDSFDIDERQGKPKDWILNQKNGQKILDCRCAWLDLIYLHLIHPNSVVPNLRVRLPSMAIEKSQGVRQFFLIRVIFFSIKTHNDF